MSEEEEKPLFWVGSALRDLRRFPAGVKRVFGYALHLAQHGGKHPNAKPMKGFSGAGVLEVVEDHDGDTYRAVYTVKFADVVYALHAFQKKSRRGIKTPKQELDRVKERVKQASEHYKELSMRKKENGKD